MHLLQAKQEIGGIQIHISDFTNALYIQVVDISGIFTAVV